MQVEINSELEPGSPTLEIPWASPRLPRLKYVDLRKYPERVASLAECRSHPPLAPLLQKINLPASPFCTAKCDVWVTAKFEEDEDLDFQFPFKVGSYLDLFFEGAGLQSRLDPHLYLAKKLEKSLAGRRLAARMQIVVRRCLFHKNGKWGYSLTLFVDAYGTTKAQAKEEWGRVLNHLGDALMKIAPAFIKKRTKRLDLRTPGAI